MSSTRSVVLALLLLPIAASQALGQAVECLRPGACIDGPPLTATIPSERSVDMHEFVFGTHEPTTAYQQTLAIDPRNAFVNVSAAVFEVEGSTSVNVPVFTGGGISRIVLDFEILADGRPAWKESRELTKTELPIGGFQFNPFSSSGERFQKQLCLTGVRSLTVRIVLRARGDIGALAGGAVAAHLEASRFSASVTPCSIDSDRDGFGAVTDCDERNNTINPGRPDICDGLNNDCDTASADGSEDPSAGRSCDGTDTDLCRNGSMRCVAAGLACVEPPTSSADLCDGRDNDCNPATVDGSGERSLGMRCDGADLDRCVEGAFVCALGRMTCTDSSGDSLEICDSADNDCDGSIDEGMSVDADADGHYAHGACRTPADDCYDTDPARFACNTPAGSGVSPFEAGECSADDGSSLQLVYASVASSSDTTCSVESCELEPPDAPGFTLSHAGQCFDIRTCAEFECGSETSCGVEICIDYDEATLEGACRLGSPEDCLTMLLIDCTDRNGDGDYEDVGECTPGAALTRSATTNPAMDRYCAFLADPGALQSLECAPSEPGVAAATFASVKRSTTAAAQRLALAVDDRDADFDGLADSEDNCDFAYNPSQLDSDADGVGNGCDLCPKASDPDQVDADGDLVGDVCDNCPATSNPKQQDADGDGTGDACG